jgi:polyphosphate kinase 2 (PPK2 family)
MTDQPAPAPIRSRRTVADVSATNENAAAATADAAAKTVVAGDATDDLAPDIKNFPVVTPLTDDGPAEGDNYPYKTPMTRRVYEAHKAQLQAELLKVQKWAQDSGQKFVILFEGRDAAGKGGTIKRFMEHLNPRLARVVALNKPSDVEARSMVLPALHRKSADSRRNGVL